MYYRIRSSKSWAHCGLHHPRGPDFTNCWQGGKVISHRGSTSRWRGDVSLQGRWYQDNSTRSHPGDISLVSSNYTVIIKNMEGISKSPGRKIEIVFQLEHSVFRWRRWGQRTAWLNLFSTETLEIPIIIRTYPTINNVYINTQVNSIYPDPSKYQRTFNLHT